MQLMNKFLSFLGLCALVRSMTADLREASERAIHEHLDEFYRSSATTGRGLCSGNSCCNITATETCSMANMPRDQSTLVLPGGETRCIFSTSTPFTFQVIPGDSDKLLFYFQGGGACWDQYSTKAQLCSTDASPQSLVGIFDRTDARNEFKDYTIVHVLYCSGDVHGGNVVRPYNDNAGQPVVQKGLANAQSALDWVKAQVASGVLAPSFSDLVVMGCSAGSLGAQLWGSQVASSLKWQRAAVVPDSYAGVFPPGSTGPLVQSYGFCTSGFLNDELQKKCDAGTMELTELDLYLMSTAPSVPWVFLQSKTDIVQQSFYVSIAISMNATQKTITPTEFYSGVNDIFGLYNAQRANFVTYLINGDHHCYTPQTVYYTADPVSDSDNGAQSQSPLLYAFVNTLPLAAGGQISTVCDGALQRGASDNTYCSSKVVPKTFVEPN